MLKYKYGCKLLLGLKSFSDWEDKITRVFSRSSQIQLKNSKK